MSDEFSKPSRRIALYGVGAVAAMIGLTVVGQRLVSPARPEAPSAAAPAAEPPAPGLSDSEREEVRRGWMRSTTLAPRAEQVDPATGEVTLPFHGFGVSVDSTPPGARVLVDGKDAGETPLLASVDCRPGAEVVVLVEKAPLRPARRPTRCRADTLVKLTVALGR